MPVIGWIVHGRYSAPFNMLRLGKPMRIKEQDDKKMSKIFLVIWDRLVETI
jgi:hypothetical protein